MAVFDWGESRSSRVEVEARVAEVRFGDGYAQRSPDGLNPIGEAWDLVFDAVDDSIGDAIENFLRARTTSLVAEAFDWSPIWLTPTTAIRVVCKRWSRVRVDLGISTITATFERVYEP